MELIEKAKEFAITAHGDQKYGKMPYEYHLQQVVSKLILWRDFNAFPITNEYIATAWVHDVIEDCDVSAQQIYDLLGFHVCKAVVLLSKTGESTYEEYLEGVLSDPISRVVKIADTLCNLEASLMSGQINRVNKYAKQLAILTEK